MAVEASFSALQWLELVGHELLLFAAVWFAIGALDELAVDVTWLFLRLTGRVKTPVLDLDQQAPLRGVAAVLVPAWREAAVVGAMIEHCLAVWPQRELRIYAGCYRNDPETLAAMIAAAPGDFRLRIVVHDADGPTTKADCLNRIHAALCDDERRGGFAARSVILHDAEDMVHPAALALLDRALDDADFVQLPVRPEPQRGSRFIAGHYGDEFAESHGKGMVVRDWLGIGIPAAGVGCAFSRRAIRVLASRRGSADPFAEECLTEDYECGLLVAEAGGARPLPALPGCRRRAGRNAGVLSGDTRRSRAAEDSLASRDRLPGMGPSRLEWLPGRTVDAHARPARTADCAGPGGGVLAAGCLAGAAVRAVVRRPGQADRQRA